MDNNEVVTEEVAAVVENNTGIEIEPLFEEQVPLKVNTLWQAVSLSYLS